MTRANVWVFGLIAVFIIAGVAVSTIDKPVLVTSEVENRLGIGDRGEEVRLLQKTLRDEGYEVGPVDGIYGRLTRDAVAKVQEDFGMEGESGTWDPSDTDKLIALREQEKAKDEESESWLEMITPNF